jgi:hypothetical protein
MIRTAATLASCFGVAAAAATCNSGPGTPEGICMPGREWCGAPFTNAPGFHLMVRLPVCLWLCVIAPLSIYVPSHHSKCARPMSLKNNVDALESVGSGRRGERWLGKGAMLNLNHCPTFPNRFHVCSGLQTTCIRTAHRPCSLCQPS